MGSEMCIRDRNTGRSKTIEVMAERIETKTSQQTTQTGQGVSITPAELYALGSSLLLLLPILITLVYLRRARRRRRR